MKNAKLIICVVCATFAAISPARARLLERAMPCLSESKTSFAPKAIWTFASVPLASAVDGYDSYKNCREEH